VRSLLGLRAGSTPAVRQAALERAVAADPRSSTAVFS
jgi:hypothetical protein